MRNIRYSVVEMKRTYNGKHRVYFRIAGETIARYRTITAPDMATAEHELFLRMDKRGIEIEEMMSAI